MSIQALRQNIPKEFRNEAMDFFEWQNGFRAEAMIGTVVQLAAKLCRTFTGSLSDFILERSGYDVHAGPGGQTEKVEKTIFMLFAFLPNAMSLIGMIPKFFYNITPEQKDRMAAELQARRAVVAQADAG
jgi:GPH family glycoside/pentoside/hexuronide:cation symporter/probable glucitol transport protein GutA